MTAWCIVSKYKTVSILRIVLFHFREKNYSIHVYITNGRKTSEWIIKWIFIFIYVGVSVWKRNWISILLICPLEKLARRWTISSWLVWHSATGDQANEAYSTTRRTFVLCTLALASRELERMFRRRKAMVEFAFCVMLLMWHWQDKSGAMVTPR